MEEQLCQIGCASTDIPADVVRIVPLELSRIHGSSCEHDVFEARCSPLDLRLDQCCHIDVRPVRNRDRTVSPRRSCSQMRDSAFLVVEGERLDFVVRQRGIPTSLISRTSSRPRNTRAIDWTLRLTVCQEYASNESRLTTFLRSSKEVGNLLQACRIAGSQTRALFQRDPKPLWPKALDGAYEPVDRYWTREQYFAAMEQMVPSRRDHVTEYCWTGVRYSELYVIEAKHIDELHRRAWVEGAKTNLPDAGFRSTQTHSRCSRGA
jgi:hypothetical protein